MSFQNKVLYVSILLVCLTSLLGFVTMFNDTDPNVLMAVASITAGVVTLYLVSVLSCKTTKTVYHYLFAIIGLFIAGTLMDYAHNGEPTHVGKFSLYTLKVLNSLGLFFFVVIAFIVFGMRHQTEKECQSGNCSQPEKLLAHSLAVNSRQRSSRPAISPSKKARKSNSVQRGVFRRQNAVSSAINGTNDSSFCHAFSFGLNENPAEQLF